MKVSILYRKNRFLNFLMQIYSILNLELTHRCRNLMMCSDWCSVQGDITVYHVRMSNLASLAIILLNKKISILPQNEINGIILILVFLFCTLRRPNFKTINCFSLCFSFHFPSKSLSYSLTKKVQ